MRMKFSNVEIDKISVIIYVKKDMIW